MPPLAFRVGQALVGAVIGALVQLSTLARLASDWPSVVLVTVGTLAISLVAGRLLALRRDVSPATGAFALIAGGASGIVALARELGADDRVVTIVQYLRVLLVLLAMPLVTTLLFHPPERRRVAERRRPPAGARTWCSWRVAVGGRPAACSGSSRAPATALLGPMLVAVAVSASGVLGQRLGAHRAGAARLRADRRPGRAAVHPGQPAQHRPAAAAGDRADRGRHRRPAPCSGCCCPRSPGSTG